LTGTDVVVGAVNGQTIQMLKKDQRGRIWAAATAGDIYVSLDNGVTWTETGSSATAQTLYDIVFYDDYVGYAVGNSNAFVYTTNGGTTWQAGTGPAVATNLVSCDVNYAGHLFVTDANADLWRSTDGGDTWERILNLTGSMPQIRFDPDFRFFGYLASNSAAPVGTVYRSEDAGNTWAAIGVPATDYANTGIHCVCPCDPNYILAGGIATGPFSMVAKFDRKA
jgi:photosystem II stability/assembly factor-like uncharacterized protein